MLTLVAGQAESLWDEALPVEVREFLEIPKEWKAEPEQSGSGKN